MQATTSLAISEIINLSQGLANTNAVYLGIGVSIIIFLAGGSYLFSVKPFKDKLDKHEEELNALRKEVGDSFTHAEESLVGNMKLFKEEYTKELESVFKQREESLTSDYVAKLASLEKELSEKIDCVVDEKNNKLKEIISTEISNEILKLEKSLSSNIENYKTKNDKEVLSLGNKSESGLRELGITVRELEAFKYDIEGKMGGIIGLVDTLGDYIKYKPYLLKFKLEEIKERIGKYTLSPELFLSLKTKLSSIKGKEIAGHKHDEAIAEIEKLIKVETNPGL